MMDWLEISCHQELLIVSTLSYLGTYIFFHALLLSFLGYIIQNMTV